MSIFDDDWDNEQQPSLGRCTANLERMSLGADGDAPACIEANKMEALAKRNVKSAKRTKREHVPGQTYKWVEKCYDVKKVMDKRPGLKQPKVIGYGQLAYCAGTKPRCQSVWCQDQNNQLHIVDWMCETCSEHALFAHPRGN